MQGTIKKLVTEKNFGFISREGGEKDVFFHADKLNGVSFSDLREGDMVTFEVEDGPKGPAATNVQKA
jgi:CspA family cold shock protein